MGASTREKGVLKLVHPGRHVEYHRRSITAGEIMRKNPRHSITRPDFFKNPDIVVRPESVMVPGQVFYIVPNTTIHRLVKNRSQQLSQPAPQQTKSPNASGYKHKSKQTSPCKLWAGTTPMYQLRQEQEGSISCAKLMREYEEDDPLDDSLTLTLQARDYYLNGYRSARGITKDSSQLLTRNDKQVKNLKSCMKKERGIRARPTLRVTFDLTTMIQH